MDMSVECMYAVHVCSATYVYTCEIAVVGTAFDACDICTQMCTYVYKCVHMYTNVYVFIQMWTYLCKCVPMYTSVYLCIQMCTYVYKCVRVYISKYLHSHISVCMHVYTCRCERTCVFLCVFSHIKTHTYVHIYIYTFVYIQS